MGESKVVGVRVGKVEVGYSKESRIGHHVIVDGDFLGWCAYFIIPFGLGEGAKKNAESVAEGIREELASE